jgi:hypothetical protein
MNSISFLWEIEKLNKHRYLTDIMKKYNISNEEMENLSLVKSKVRDFKINNILNKI